MISTSAIFPPLILTLTARISRPPGAHTSPTEPSSNAGRTNLAIAAKDTAPRAHSRAPWISRAAPGRAATSSICTTTSGSKSATRPSISPARSASRNELTTSRCCRRSASGTFATPCARRRARWPVVASPSACAPQSCQFHRRTNRTCRAGQTRPAPAVSAGRERRGALVLQNPQEALPVRD